MDMGRAVSEVGERLELRGVDPDQVFSDPDAWTQYWQVVNEVVDDMIAQQAIYGDMSNGGNFTGFLGES